MLDYNLNLHVNLSSARIQDKNKVFFNGGKSIKKNLMLKNLINFEYKNTFGHF